MFQTVDKLLEQVVIEHINRDAADASMTVTVYADQLRILDRPSVFEATVVNLIRAYESYSLLLHERCSKRYADIHLRDLKITQKRILQFVSIFLKSDCGDRIDVSIWRDLICILLSRDGFDSSYV